MFSEKERGCTFCTALFLMGNSIQFLMNYRYFLVCTSLPLSIFAKYIPELKLLASTTSI